MRSKSGGRVEPTGRSARTQPAKSCPRSTEWRGLACQHAAVESGWLPHQVAWTIGDTTRPSLITANPWPGQSVDERRLRWSPASR